MSRAYNLEAVDRVLCDIIRFILALTKNVVLLIGYYRQIRRSYGPRIDFRSLVRALSGCNFMYFPKLTTLRMCDSIHVREAKEPIKLYPIPLIFSSRYKRKNTGKTFGTNSTSSNDSYVRNG